MTTVELRLAISLDDLKALMAAGRLTLATKQSYRDGTDSTEPSPRKVSKQDESSEDKPSVAKKLNTRTVESVAPAPDSDDESDPKPKKKAGSEDESDPKPKSTKKAESEDESDPKPKKKAKVESEDESDPKPKKKAKAESEDESDPKPKKKAKAESEDESDPKPKKKAKAESEDESDPKPKKPTKKAALSPETDDEKPAKKTRKDDSEDSESRKDESDDSEPPEKVGKKGGKATKFQTVNKAKGGPNWDEAPEYYTFAKGTNYLVFEDAVVGKWSSKGVQQLSKNDEKNVEAKGWKLNSMDVSDIKKSMKTLR